MLEMAINNVEMGSELDRVHILTCCDTQALACIEFWIEKIYDNQIF